ncbi:hypothetical protein FUAX_38200 [Fulvitalea axinellae]|uniref:Glycosyl hydrolase-like 10 domain-containing protein n=1 Tax=Fulvitalea axinellae TaxID=1182444 RepID=A0AAU9CTH4_9BACT|nr:hypothetical protein FUAX_38200 [Fulvitalea axinellae]
MRRREFIKVMAVTATAVGVGACGTGAEAGTGLKNWAWVRGMRDKSEEEILEFCKKLKSNGIHGILPEGHYEIFKRLAPIVKKSGLELHTWRWTMNRGDYMKDHPEIYAVSRNGESVVDKPPYVKYYRFLCPSSEKAQQFIIDDYVRIAKLDGVDAVHLDYVRYVDVILPIALQPKYNLVQDHEMPEFDFCYCERCRGKFKEKYGQDPLDMEDPSQSKEWHQFRLDTLSAFVRRIVDAVHAEGKKVSGAVFPSPSISRKIVRQDWPNFNLDVYMPMLYFKDYKGDLNWIKERITENKRYLKPHQKMYAGLHVGHVREIGMKPVVETCLKHGADGVTFFTGHSLKDEEWKEFAQATAAYS